MYMAYSASLRVACVYWKTLGLFRAQIFSLITASWFQCSFSSGKGWFWKARYAYALKERLLWAASERPRILHVPVSSHPRVGVSVFDANSSPIFHGAYKGHEAIFCQAHLAQECGMTTPGFLLFCSHFLSASTINSSCLWLVGAVTGNGLLHILCHHLGFTERKSLG